VGTESGPPPEVVTSVFQDSTGFLWIAARDGLFRYDGYSVVTYEHDASDPGSISDHSVRIIYEDREGRLWVGTNTGGLNLFDRASGRFEHYRHDSADPHSLSHDSVYAILQDREGVLWIGTQMGLNRFDPETGRFERLRADPGRPGSLTHDYVISIYEDREGRLWVGTLGGGLNRWDPQAQGFVSYLHDPDDPRSVSHNRVLSITEDAGGDLWMGTASGLNRMDPEAGTFERFLHDPEDPSSLSYSLVSSVAPGPPGKLWAGTFGGGLNQLDIATGTFEVLRHDPSRRSSLSSDRIMYLLAGDEGTLWIATWGGGLSRLTRSSVLFAAQVGGDPTREILDGQDVAALTLDRREGVWAGTRSGQVAYRDPETSEYRVVLEDVAGIVLQLAEDDRGRLWIGSSIGVQRFDPRTGRMTDFFHDPADPESLGPGYVKGLLFDRQGRLWVGTGEGGLQRLDRYGRVLERHLHDPADEGTLSDNYVTAILEDSRGTLWVGTRSGGVNAVHPGTGRTRRFLPSPEDPRSISHHYVTALLEDSEGRLWVGTAGGGLNRVKHPGQERPSFARFTENDGLIDNDIMGLLEDDDGTLWLSTKRGLSRFDPESGAVANFYVADGLPTGDFEAGAAARSAEALYFGSVKGLVDIPAGTAFPPPAPSPTLITSIRTPEGELRGEQPPWRLERLRVPYGEWLSLEIAILDFNTVHNHAYAYRLGGERKGWIDLGGRRAITFTELSPGTHEFEVKGRNCQGVWSEAGSRLQIEVVPPFWMTPWFRALGVLLVVAVALAIYWRRTAALEKRNRELVALIEQRERAREELGRAYERLRYLTRRLEAAKEEERRVIARELHDEMGPTLTAVIINLQLLARDPDTETRNAKIADAVELVDRMIQKVRDISLDLRPPLLDELGLLPALRGYLETQGKRAELDIEVSGESSVSGLSPEVEITAFRVAQEAVTNVLRHAEATRATVDVREDRGDLELVVRDNGRGFDVGDTMGGATGTSLGLLGMQERVRMLGGEIQIDSTPGAGTLVRVRMPLEVHA
jgi:signal transduction histidine kinase/ligand-binding sensor domain-containing protein